MCGKIAVGYFFALAHYVAGGVFVTMDDVVLIDCVMIVTHNVFVADYALCAGAGKFLAYYSAAALVTTVCAIAIHHIKSPLFFVHVLYYETSGFLLQFFACHAMRVCDILKCREIASQFRLAVTKARFAHFVGRL